MLTPEESARAIAEVELSEFISRVYEQPAYWQALPLSDEDISRMNALARDSPGEVMDQRFLVAPRWVEGAKQYATTMIKGFIQTHLQADSPSSAIDSVAAFWKACDELNEYLWREHFSFLADSWNRWDRSTWQDRLPDFPVREIDYEHFDILMGIWREEDPFRPEELASDAVETFWAERAELSLLRDGPPQTKLDEPCLSPAALRDAYLASFPGEKIKILDICWASRQRYREWTRWTGGKLKNGSKPDVVFRAILKSGKRPEEYRPETRPKGWK
jgi:hypothetical protein